MFYNTDSDSSDYSESDEDDDGDVTDEDLLEISSEEKHDTKYLAIFQNKNEEFDEQIMSLDDSNELKKLEQSMMDCTDKGYYRCKIKHDIFYNECRTAITKFVTP